MYKRIETKPSRGKLLLLGSMLAASVGLPSPALAGTPTVNGQFYGDGDYLNYPSTPYATSAGGSTIYLTLVDGTLYVALVVSRSVNDTMMAPKNVNGNQYIGSGGWGGHREGKRLMDSEFAGFSLTVGSGATEQTWNWQQAFGGGVGALGDNFTNESWESLT